MDHRHSLRLALRFSGRPKCFIRSLGSKINIPVDFTEKTFIAASTNDTSPISRNCIFWGESPLRLYRLSLQAIYSATVFLSVPAYTYTSIIPVRIPDAGIRRFFLPRRAAPCARGRPCPAGPVPQDGTADKRSPATRLRENR